MDSGMDKLKAAPGRVIIKVNRDEKNWHTFSHGQIIRHERGPNNLNYRETQPVQGEVIDADSISIPPGGTVLFQHNATHDSYRIFNYQPFSSDMASDIRYYSIPESACYLYRLPEGTEWFPLNGFTTGLRVFKPYTGLIQGIPPEVFKDTLYITSGHLKGLVVHTLRACDYEIVFMGSNGQEQNIIRCRHWEDPRDDIHKREEIIMIDMEKTDLVKRAKLWLGITPADAKPLFGDRLVFNKKEKHIHSNGEIEDLNDKIDYQPNHPNRFDSEPTKQLCDEFGQWPHPDKFEFDESKKLFKHNK